MAGARAAFELRRRSTDSHCSATMSLQNAIKAVLAIAGLADRCPSGETHDRRAKPQKPAWATTSVPL